MSSFDYVDYSVRPNKNVERKLLFEAIHSMSGQFAIAEYEYIGMGSMWFTDFVLAHKLLRIRSMTSIEHEPYAERADFNKPYQCIDVVGGDTSLILPTLSWEKASVVWLDYDTGIDGPVLGDLEIVIEKAKTGSIILVTVNAHVSSLPKYDENDNEITRRQAFERSAGTLIPPSAREQDFTKKGYPKILAQTLFVHLHKCFRRSARHGRFEPIFNFAYSDNSPMITVGGMLIDDDIEDNFSACDPRIEFDYANGEEQYWIDVPVLTSKEKVALDYLLPNDGVFDNKLVRKEYGFELSQSKLNGYQKFYKVYPVFGELPI